MQKKEYNKSKNVRVNKLVDMILNVSRYIIYIIQKNFQHLLGCNTKLKSLYTKTLLINSTKSNYLSYTYMYIP